MAEKPTPKTPNPNKGPGRLKSWGTAVDGSMVSHVFAHASAADADVFARRALHLAYKSAQSIEIRLDGSAVTVRFAAKDGLVPHLTRVLANKLLPKSEEEKAKHAAFRAAKASGGGATPKAKPAPAKTSSPKAAAKAPRAAAAKAKPAK